MNQELSTEVGEIMRKLVALSAAAVVATALVGGPALADVPTKSKPPVTLQGKVNNKSTATVKKGKISVEEDDYYFKPTFLKAKPGTTVTVSLKNEGKTQHTFTIDALGVDQTLNPDQKATVTVTLPANGATNFYCRFHGPSGTEGNFGMQGAFYSKNGEAVSTGGGASASAGSAPTPTTTGSTSSPGGMGSGY
jgi:plastocyanin